MGLVFLRKRLKIFKSKLSFSPTLCKIIIQMCEKNHVKTLKHFFFSGFYCNYLSKHIDLLNIQEDKGLGVFFATPLCRRDPNSPTRDRTCTPCTGSAESQPLDRQGSPR